MGGGERLLAAMRARPILLDGGMGTSLVDRLGYSYVSNDASRANLIFPTGVSLIHCWNVRAGSDALLANTFGANRPKFLADGFADEVEAVNRRGVVLARQAAGPERFVLGSMGPIRAEGAARWYREQAEILWDAGADALFLETHTFEQALVALDSLVGVVPTCVLASLWTWPDDARSAARRLEDAGASAIGTNCGRGLRDVLIATEKIAGAVSVPLIAKPSNAKGLPGSERIDSPENFARAAARFVSLGVRLLGGCCGTDERDIAAMRHALDSL